MPQKPRPQIVVYPTNEEYKIIQQKANEIGLSMSKYLILCGVKANIKVNVEKSE